eukprot:Gb_36203 [translate_table: standard]
MCAKCRNAYLQVYAWELPGVAGNACNGLTPTVALQLAAIVYGANLFSEPLEDLEGCKVEVVAVCLNKFEMEAWQPGKMYAELDYEPRCHLVGQVTWKGRIRPPGADGLCKEYPSDVNKDYEKKHLVIEGNGGSLQWSRHESKSLLKNSNRRR